MSRFHFYLFSFVLCAGLVSDLAHAAACCGGNFASPAMISGDEKGLLSIAWSEAQITDYADPQGKLRRQGGISERSLQISGAGLLSDRWQLGALSSIKQQNRSDVDATSTALGDSSLLLAFEAVPEWNYNPLIPHGYTFLQVTAPTGVSTYESRKTGNVDVTGNGFWTVGGGAMLLKAWGPWDAQAQLEIHQGFARRFDNPTYGKMNAKPGIGGSTYVSGGYSFGDWRTGLGLRHSDDGPVKLTGTSTSTSEPKRYSSVVLTVNYLIERQWALALNYSDDTIFGAPSNALLSRALTLTLQHRWAR